MNELTWMNWNEELNRMNCNKLLDMNESKSMTWKECIAKSAPNPSDFYDFHVKSSSCCCYTLVRILPTSSPNSGMDPAIVLRFWCETELSLQSRADFVDHFPDRGAKPRKQRPSSGRQLRPLYPKKNAGFRTRECFQPWIHAFPLNYFMMMWLTWWCGWHDFATAGCENRS